MNAAVGRSRLGLLAVAVVCGVAATGCGSSKPNASTVGDHSATSVQMSSDGDAVSVQGPAGAAAVRATSYQPAETCPVVGWQVSATALTNFVLAPSDFVAVDASGTVYTPIYERGAMSSTRMQRGSTGGGYLYFGVGSSNYCPSSAPPSDLTLEYKPYGGSGVLAEWPQAKPINQTVPSPGSGYVPLGSGGAYG